MGVVKSARALLATVLVSLIAIGPAASQEWPTKPVRLIVTLPPGGSTDATARAYAEALHADLGQTVVVDNRPGGNSIIGVQTAMMAPRDGYTLLVLTLATAAIHPHMRKVPYDPQRDFIPIGRIADAFFGLAVHPDVPAKTLEEFIAYAKANPGKLHFGSASVGGTTHLAPEVFSQEAGIEMSHVPYKGSSEALRDLLGGHIQVLFEGIVFPHHRAGKLRVLGVTTPERRPEWPAIPAIREVVPTFEMANWFGIVALAGTPEPVVARMSAALNRAAERPDVKERLLAMGMIARTDTPEAMAADMRRQHERFGKLVAKLGIAEQ